MSTEILSPIAGAASEGVADDVTVPDCARAGLTLTISIPASNDKINNNGKSFRIIRE
jgi:hypothetical protein